MLVPSTLTGWYKKIMMNAEIASDMTRSRSQTEKTGKPRGGTGEGLLTWAVGELVGLASSVMLPLIIRIRVPPLKVAPQVQLRRCLVVRASVYARLLRSSRRKIFPDAVFGIVSTKRIRRGCLK